QACPTPWHFLYFLPEPQKQGSLRPIFWMSGRAFTAAPPPDRTLRPGATGFCGGAGGSGSPVAGSFFIPSARGSPAAGVSGIDGGGGALGASTLKTYSTVDSRTRSIIATSISADSF